MRSKLWVKTVYCLVFAVVVALPAPGLGADFSLVEEREQELVGPESIRELARVHYARARNYYRRGEYSEAKAEFEEVLKLDPEHQGARWYLKCAEKELSEYEKGFRGRQEKLKEKRKLENLKSALDSIEERSVEGKLRVEKGQRKQLENKLNELSEQIEEYRSETDQAKKRKKSAIQKAAQLQKEKDHSSTRLKEVEAEKQKLAVQLDKLRQDQQAQLKDKIKKYEQSLQDKFGQKIAELNKKIESYEAAAKQYEAKAKQLEKTTQQLGQVQAEKADLQAKLEELRQEQQVQLKDELQEYEKTLKDKLTQKEVQFDKRIDIYEGRLAQLEEERQQLEKLSEDTHKQTLQLKEAYEEKADLQAKLEELRQEQQVQLKDELQKYEKALEDKLTQKLTQFNEKIEQYEAKIKTLQQFLRSSQEQLSSVQDKLKEKPAPQKESAPLEDEQRLTKQQPILQVQKKVEKQERLRLKREAEEKSREEARLKKEQERKAKEERLAKLKAEKEAEERARQEEIAYQEAKKKITQQQLQKKIELHYAQGKKHFANKDYIAARKEFKDILILDPKNQYALNALEKVNATEAREEKEYQRRKKEKEEAKIKKRQEEARLKKEQERQAQEERLAKLQAEKEEKLRLKREAEEKRREEARLKKEQERKAREEQLAKLKAEKEEKLRLKREAEAKQSEQKRLAQERKVREEALERAQAELAKQLKIKARQEELARIKAEKEEKLRLKREAEEKRREEARLKKEQERKACEERLANIKAEKEAEERARQEEIAYQEAKKKITQQQLQKKIELHYTQGKKHFANKDYIAARKEFKDILILDPKNQYALNALEKVNATEAREEKEYQRRKKEEEEAEIKKRRQEARLKKEQERQAQEERLAKLQAEKEEKLRLKREAEEKRREEARLKKEQERKAREEQLAKLKAEKEEGLPEEVQGSVRNKELRLHLAQGKIYFYREQYEQALEEFQQMLLLDPEYPSVGEYIRKCQKGIEEQKHKQLQTKEKKAVHLEKTVELVKEEKQKEKQDKIKEFYKKGKMYFSRGLYSEAIACFEEVVDLEGNPRIHYTPQAQEYIERAKTGMEEENKEAAQRIAEEEVERKKDEEMQKLKAKERTQEEARRREEETIHGHYQLGKKYYRQRNYPMAIAEFNKIKEINPQHSYVSYAERYIEKCQQKIIQREEAELRTEMKKETKDLLKGKEIEIKKEESLSENLLAQARWYYERGDYEQTIKICRAILELDPLNKKARNLLYKAELKQIEREQKQGYKGLDIDEKDMLAAVAQAQVLPEERVLPVKEKEITPIVKAPAIREKLNNPVTVDFRDVDLSYVLNFLADSTGVNIIPASGVSLEGKKVSIRMKDMPAENALKYILKNQGLAYRIEQDAVWVASPSEMDKEEVETRVYFLSRGSGMFTEFERTVGTGTGLGGAGSISKITTIKDVLEQAVDWPKNSKLVFDERTGALIIANIPSNLQIIEDILYNLDITPMQVLIEARFVELQVTDVEQLGIEWGTTAALGDKRRDGSNVTQWESGSGMDFTAFTRATEGLNLTYTGLLTYPEFQAVLHALSETQSAKTLSSPRITTLNNQMATIKVVDEWIYPTRYEFQVVQSDVNGDGDFDDANETTYSNVPVDFVTKDIGILLHVTPNIGGDGKTITLALVPEVSEGTAGYFSYTGSVSLPKFSSRTLSTSVVINNGDTVALGGLIKESSTKTTTKVPLLGDIPILGYLFRKQNDSIIRTNLLIFVTATIISPSGEMVETVSQP